MKKLFIAGAIAIAALFNAQEANEGLKGTWFATIQGGYSSNGASGDSKSTTVAAVPIVGTFVTPNVAVGVGAGIISTKVGNADAANITVIEPLVRKYWNVAGNLYFFGQGAVPVLLSKNTSTYGLTLTPGLDYVVNSWFTVELSATVASLHFTSVKGGDTSTAFNLNPVAHSTLGVPAQVGFKFLF